MHDDPRAGQTSVERLVLQQVAREADVLFDLLEQFLRARETHLVAQSINKLDFDILPIQLAFKIKNVRLYDRPLRLVIKCRSVSDVGYSLFPLSINLHNTRVNTNRRVGALLPDLKISSRDSELFSTASAFLNDPHQAE